MSWFFWSLIQIPLTSAAMLIFKKSQLKGLSSELSLLIFFIASVLSIFSWHFFFGIPFMLPPFFETSILLFAGIFAVSANLSLLTSFQKSTNPGFSLAIFSAKIIFVAIGGFLFFKDPISLTALLGIVLIIMGIFLMHTKKTEKSLNWSFWAFLAAIFSALYWMPLKLVDQRIPDLDLTVILTLVIIPQILILSFIVLKRREIVSKANIFVSLLWILALAGVIGTIDNLVGIHAVLLAPNPGYSLAVTSSYVIVVAIVSKFLFKSSLQPRFAIATAVIIIGVVIIHLGA